jgi:hypothetical protein
MRYFLDIDENKYLTAIATIGGGIEADIDLTEYDLTGDRIRAHKWENDTLIFDTERYAEIEAENEQQKEVETTPTEGGSVYDELAAAYKQGVQEA